MKKYLLKQKFNINGVTAEESKCVDIQLFVAEEGLSKQQIMNLFNTIACGFASFLGEETDAYVEVDKLQKFGDIKGGLGHETEF